MIPVEQTILKPPLGNCYAACIASIFEVDLDDVPHCTEEEGTAGDSWIEYEARLNREFFNPRGFMSVIIDANAGWVPSTYAVLSAKSPRGDWEHAVVWNGKEIEYDPHPKRDMGVGEWKCWVVFLAINPSRMWQGNG